MNINNDWLTRPTGDPFADVGGLVIKYLQEKNPDKAIIDLVTDAANIYVKRWDNNLHSFFLNSTITHNSNKGQKGIDKTLQYYKGLINDEGATDGYCRITGQKGKVFLGARDNHIMSGSGTLINFHHGFESGIMLSKESLIRMFFIPFGVEQLGDKVALLISNKQAVTEYFVRKNVDANYRELASGMSSSILKSDFSNPINALFDYASQCIDNVKSATVDEVIGKSNTKGVELNLYHFTNFGAKPTIEFYRLPALVFSFYAYCVVKHKKDWTNFVYRYYISSKFKNATYDAALQHWQNAKENADYNTFKVWRNRVFENLMNDKSLLPLFLRHSKTQIFNFKIVEDYQINIKNMEKKSLEKIKQLAAYVVNDRSDDDIKKRMTRLNGAKNRMDLRSFLLKLLKENYDNGNAEPLFTLEDYVESLFPDGLYWSDVRDLLLIAIYQKLHEANKKIEALAEEETEDVVE